MQPIPENHLNTGKGRDFQALSATLLAVHFTTSFDVDLALPIGYPAKAHRFDLVSKDQRFVGECKNYAWTVGGNVPSAKMAFMNEAMLYLSLAPAQATTFLVVRRDGHAKRGETIADYYCRTYRHLFGTSFVVEIDVEARSVREVGRRGAS